MNDKYDNQEFVGYEFSREEINQKHLELGLVFFLMIGVVVLSMLPKAIKAIKEANQD